MLSGKADRGLRRNPREIWYRNLEEVTVDGDFEVTFRLKRAQPAFMAMLASGVSPVYPCHVDPAQMRTHPIGTGPFEFAEYRQNKASVLKKNERSEERRDGKEWVSTSRSRGLPYHYNKKA